MVSIGAHQASAAARPWSSIGHADVVVALARCGQVASRRRSRRGPVRSPPTSHHAAGLPPPPSIVSAPLDARCRVVEGAIGPVLQVDLQPSVGVPPVAAERDVLATRSTRPASAMDASRRADRHARLAEARRSRTAPSRRRRARSRSRRAQSAGVAVEREEADETRAPLVRVVVEPVREPRLLDPDRARGSTSCRSAPAARRDGRVAASAASRGTPPVGGA